MAHPKAVPILSDQEQQASIELLQTAFRQARPYILERAGKDVSTAKADGSPVSPTDVAVERDVLELMGREFPGLPVFGEESGYTVETLPEACWLIDPVDGTKNFLKNEPGFTCMAVLIQNGEATASIIYDIVADVMFTAEKGKGAYKNGEQLAIALRDLPATALCKQDHVPVLRPILAQAGVVCEPIMTGGGFGFMMVADGLSAARFNLSSRGQVHDYAPGALLVREAGGDIIPVLEDEYTFETRSFVACHPALTAIIRAQLPAIRALESL